jgi:hypothetical protein
MTHISVQMKVLFEHPRVDTLMIIFLDEIKYTLIIKVTRPKAARTTSGGECRTSLTHTKTINGGFMTPDGSQETSINVAVSSENYTNLATPEWNEM